MVGAQEIPEEIKGSEFEEVDVVLDCVCRRPWIEDTSIDPHSLRQLKVVYISPWSMYARQSSEITNWCGFVGISVCANEETPTGDIVSGEWAIGELSPRTSTTWVSLVPSESRR